MSKTSIVLSLASIVLGASVLGGGCGGAQASSVCEKICACEPCTDTKRKECVTEADAAQLKADEQGCAGPFDALSACLTDRIGCSNKHASVSACAAEIDEVESCAKGLSPFGDVCTAGNDHLIECLGGLPPGGAAKCDGKVSCAANCYAAASCAVLKDAFSGMPTDKSKSLFACTSKC